MSSQDVPAIIAASVLPLIGTVVTQVIGFRSTSADTKRQIQATRQNTADTLEQQRVENEETRGQQRDQLDTTLQAQSERLHTAGRTERAAEANPRGAATRTLPGPSVPKPDPFLPVSTSETL